MRNDNDLMLDYLKLKQRAKVLQERESENLLEAFAGLVALGVLWTVVLIVGWYYYPF